jgi:hypothetical protein
MMVFKSTNNDMLYVKVAQVLLIQMITGLCQAETIEMAMKPISVHESNINVFSTPIAYYKGSIFTVNVEPPGKEENGINLHTVVRHGRKNADGNWQWRKTTIETETLDDPYHTQASIGVDERGFIHVAYNMHNMPWQYSVSESSGSIEHFVFRGEPLTTQQKMRVKYENKTSFPTMGDAAIPGNQVTYPAFFNDRYGKLYVTYRYALRPARPFARRAFAGGLAKYDVGSGRWSQIGGNVYVTPKDASLPGKLTSFATTPFLFDENWIVYLPGLTFDKANNMHVSWTWRKHGAGRETKFPSYAMIPDGSSIAYSANGTQYTLPINFSGSDKVIDDDNESEFFAHTWPVADMDGIPAVLISPISDSRKLVNYDKKSGHWLAPESTPNAASIIMVDDDGQQWAFASGLRIFRRAKNHGKWQKIYSDKTNTLCSPKVLSVPEERLFFIHALCQNNTVKILRLIWDGYQ